MTPGIWIDLGLVAILIIVVIAVNRRRRRAATREGIKKSGPGFVGSPEANRATLLALRDAGGSLTSPTEVNFYLYFPTRDAAERAAAMAQTSQLTGSVKEAAIKDGTWVLLLTGNFAPTQTAIDTTSKRLEAVAAEFGGEYDGWEAKVQ